MNKKILAFLTISLGMLISATPAFAHAIVKPNQVGVASTQTFTLTVPTEKDGGTTTSVRLLIPQGLNFVTPVVQSGWTAIIKTSPIPAGTKAPVADDGDVADSIPTEIDWTGGSIPSGQEAFFQFSAQVPDKPTELDWKIYQGYQDGSTVSWDLGPKDQQPKDDKGNLDFDSKGPYSKTMVVNDLNGSSSDMSMGVTASKDMVSASNSDPRIEVLALTALALSAVAIGLHLRRS